MSGSSNSGSPTGPEAVQPATAIEVEQGVEVEEEEGVSRQDVLATEDDKLTGAAMVPPATIMSNLNGNGDGPLAGHQQASIKAEVTLANVDSDAGTKLVEGDGGNPRLLQEDSVEPPAKKVRSNEDMEVRFLISSKEAGAIIGKGGANINHLRKHYKSSVTVPDCPGPERVLAIVTKEEHLTDILKDIVNYVDDRPVGQKQSDREIEMRLLVHTSHAGGIIGRGGQRIRELRDETKAAIKVFTQCCPQSTERVCALQGVPSVVVEAVKTVLNVILATPIKGAVKLYDPFNFDVYMAPEYGGFTEPGPSNRSSGGSGGGGNNPRGQTSSVHRRPPSFEQPVGAGMGVGMGIRPGVGGGWNGPPRGVGGRPPFQPMEWPRGNIPPMGGFDVPPGTERRSASQAPYQRWHTENGGHRGVPLPPLPGAGGGEPPVPYWSDAIPQSEPSAASLPPNPLTPMHGWVSPFSQSSAHYEPSNLVENADGSASATLTVPNNVAGAIIGKGGNRIRLVRRDSGADISIDNGTGPGTDRTVMIKGNQDQVRMAYSMLQRSIAENSR